MARGFRCLLAAEPDGTPARVVERDEDELDEGDVTIEVAWSSLNYKDALGILGAAPVARRFPLVCGIDLAGTVVASSAADLEVGSVVAVTGCGLGEERDGGYSELARVPSTSCVRLEGPAQARVAMALGTAGLTAALCVHALEAHGALSTRAALPVLVTGAAGGVGSVAVALLSRAGHRVVASTGRLEERAYLEQLGASELIGRDVLADAPEKPLDKERYAAAVDVVGGATLSRLVSQLARGGAVAACGLTGGAELALSVHPFILRGVSLLGVNAVAPPASVREEAWRRLFEEIDPRLLDEMTTTIGFDELVSTAPALLAGRVRGRVLVQIG